VETQLRSGHPDVEGLCRALVDWSTELRLLQNEPSVGHCCATVGPRSLAQHRIGRMGQASVTWPRWAGGTHWMEREKRNAAPLPGGARRGGSLRSRNGSSKICGDQREKARRGRSRAGQERRGDATH
jgi:hypothetical protein